MDLFWINCLINKKKSLNNIGRNTTPYELKVIKDQISQYYLETKKDNIWNKINDKTFKFSMISFGTRRISRAYYKIAEILNVFKPPKPVNAACLCEAPGGFVEYIQSSYPESIIHAISRSEIAWSSKLIINENVNLHVHDIFNPDLLLDTGIMDLVTADGAIDSSRSYCSQEIDNFLLFQREIEVAVELLKIGGTFILKIFDFELEKTQTLIFWLLKMFKEVRLCKPPTSKPTNSEKYLYCSEFTGKINIKDSGFIQNYFTEELDICTKLQIDNIQMVLNEINKPSNKNYMLIQYDSVRKYNESFTYPSLPSKYST